MFFLTLKTIHIIFVTSWFAMLFYLPRIYVNLAQIQHTASQETYDTLVGMAHRLLRFGNKLATIAIVCGIWMMVQYHIGQGMLWLHIKLFFVLILFAYHIYCAVILHRFKRRENQKSHIYYRVFNEIPVILLIIIVILVVFKPI
ncbi:CopD family protein [Basilea psittacipulmonis]|uniref:Protoporphyrinogen IX oxidase n=1 Tax=Basilea psittacipulmonis DSM 24701 TaxID=1072685 RepID=A0A077DCL0_9BURK|nr:CopD family protein [Basilea psittacipulmonis]AIL32334.1 membrane protein [Basilea psittacipulmonis DSM 24701]